jgi:DNA-binding response OmpR family regulator
MASGTVLVVDDDRQLVATIRDALAEEGYDVVAAAGEEAVYLARVWRPRVILLNVGLPGADGVELSRWLRAELATADRMLADDRLPKPFGLRELYAAVARWLPAGVRGDAGPWRADAAARSPQPFMPVRAMPWMKYRWAAKKRATVGAVMTTAAAMSSDQSAPCCP